MNWEAISGVAEIVGAIVVVVSLIYVAVQIKQNTQAIRYQTSQDLVKANSESAYLLSTNPELADIFQRGIFDRDALSPAEQLQFNAYIYGYYNQVDFIFEQFSKGHVLESTWRKIEKELPVWISLPGVQTWWSEDKQRFSPEFARFMDRRIREFDAPAVVPTIGKGSDGNAT